MVVDPSHPTSNTPDEIDWAGRVWANFTRLQCAGVLHIALRYGDRQSTTNALIETLANLAWPDLGRPLQLDVTRALLELRRLFGR